MGTARVAAQRDEVETGLVQLGRDRGEGVVLAVAAWGVVLHVDRHDGAPREQLGKFDLFDRAGAHDLEAKPHIEALAGSNHHAQ
jgi:hypothetical protein